MVRKDSCRYSEAGNLVVFGWLVYGRNCRQRRNLQNVSAQRNPIEEYSWIQAHLISLDCSWSAKKGLNIHDYADIICAGKMLQRYGIHKGAAWHLNSAIPIACFKLGVEPYKLIAFLHRFEQFVAISKAKGLKEAFECAKTYVSTYFSLKRRKIKL
jgi:hypothetical protein